MSLKKWNSEPVADDDINGMNSSVLTLIGLNTLRSIDAHAGQKFNTMTTLAIDGFGDVFSDADGKDGRTAITTATTALFDTNFYKPFTLVLGTLHDISSFTNPSYVIDYNNSTAATKVHTANNVYYIGETFGAAHTLTSVKVKFTATTSGSPGAAGVYNGSIIIQKYDGVSVWSDVTTLGTWSNGAGADLTFSYDSTYSASITSASGIRLKITSNTPGVNLTLSVYTIDSRSYEEDAVIELTIPTGKFPATTDTAFATCLVKDWEAGANIQYQFANATESSGYFDIGSVNTFTAFTSEPTKLQIKLIPKTSSPTAGYPSIYGAWGVAT